MEESKIINKHLIFHFYITKRWRDNIAYNVHLKCLKYFRDVFDEVSFFFATEEREGMEEDIREIESILIDIFFDKRITFKIVPNTYLNEAETFYNEVIKSNRGKNELVFFAHTKGVTNIERGFNKENIIGWILMMYYYNLNFMNDVGTSLLSEVAIFYGNFKTPDNTCASIGGGGGYLYAGTFYWLNIGRLNKEPIVFNRWLAELYPSLYNANYLYTYKGIYFEKINLYHNPVENTIEEIEMHNKDDIENYHKFEKLILIEN